VKKSKIAFVCQDCGSEYTKWQGQCHDCNAWNTLKQIQLGNARSERRREGYAGTLEAVQTLGEVALAEQPRLASSSDEFNRVLGGGLVAGSAVLISGSPGAGKSTLLIQILCELAKTQSCLYVTGEESLAQIAMRANRLRLQTDRLKVMSQTSVEAIGAVWDQARPNVLVIDSIQVMQSDLIESAPGSVTQVRETAAQLIQKAKQTGTILILVGHVTKDGNLAGPRVLEHMIDSFLMLEGDADGRYRTLRSIKNRFGAVNELGIFAMTDQGLKDVANPSAIFLNRAEIDTPGSIVMAIWEGTRPLLVEAQALVDQSAFSNPRRIAVGFEQNRLAMLLAVLSRHGGLQVADQDVYINAVGGIRVDETSSDLAVLMAVVSSFRNRALPRDLICFGEVGLSGEIRPVPNGQERLREAAKHGFTRGLVPKGNFPKQPIKGMELKAVSQLSEALSAAGDWL
jgi:DNA repair protein RadA/Sms